MFKINDFFFVTTKFIYLFFNNVNIVNNKASLKMLEVITNAKFILLLHKQKIVSVNLKLHFL